MRVLMIAFEYYPIMGGGGSYVKNLIFELSRHGTEVILLTNGDREFKETHTRNKLTIFHYSLFHDLYFGRGDIVKAVDLVAKKIKEFQPDIIHTHHTLETLIVESANINFSLPHVVTHHKTPEYRNESYKLNGKWSMFKYANLEKSYKKYFIAPSQAFVDSLMDSKVNPEDVYLVYPGVDRNIFKKSNNQKTKSELKRRLNIDEKDLLILIPAQIRERKGIEFALSALRELTIKNRKIKILVTGLCNVGKDEKRKFSTLVAPNGLLDILEPFTDKEMPVLYNLANLVILPSQAEGLGMVLLEAMACETPVLGTNVIGINEVIEDGVNGQIVEFGDKRRLVSKAKILLINKEARNRLIENGKVSLQLKFNLQTQTKKHIDIYNELLKVRHFSNTKLTVRGIKCLLANSKEYKEVIDDSEVLSLLVIGSIPHDQFIPGWSDIDLLCLVKNSRKLTLDKIAKLEKFIEKQTGVKTGIEILVFEELKLSSKDLELSVNFLKFFKNFYKHIDRKKILFLRHGVTLPIFEEISFNFRDLFMHSFYVSSYMRKYLRDIKVTNKDLVRKLLKNTIFLMQSYLLFRYSEFVDDYDYVIRKYSICCPQINLSIVQKYFNMRSKWFEVKNEDIQPIDVDSCWSVFSEVVSNNIKSKNK